MGNKNPVPLFSTFSLGSHNSYDPFTTLRGSAAVGGGYAQFTGTSFATPFVTGSTALMMEWGIVKGNDAYLYGEKAKAYLRRGAKELTLIPQEATEYYWTHQL